MLNVSGKGPSNKGSKVDLKGDSSRRQSRVDPSSRRQSRADGTGGGGASDKREYDSGDDEQHGPKTKGQGQGPASPQPDKGLGSPGQDQGQGQGEGVEGVEEVVREPPFPPERLSDCMRKALDSRYNVMMSAVAREQGGKAVVILSYHQ